MNARAIRWVVISIVAAAAIQVTAFGPKEVRDNLDLLVFTAPQLRLVESLVASIRSGRAWRALQISTASASENGPIWSFTIDERRGLPSLVTGGAIPFFPGPANSLDWDGFESGCTDIQCLADDTVEQLARDFLNQYKTLFPVNQDDLVLDPDGTLAIGQSIYLLRFQWQPGGVPVEGGSIYFRINNGNLIQVVTDRIGPIDGRPAADPVARSGSDRALQLPRRNPDEHDYYSDLGSLRIVPVTPAHQNTELFEGEIGSGIAYRLAYRFAFTSPGVLGTWEGPDRRPRRRDPALRRRQPIRPRPWRRLPRRQPRRRGRPAIPVRRHRPACPQQLHRRRPAPSKATTPRRPSRASTPGSPTTAARSTTTTTEGDVDFSLGTGTDCDVPPGNNGGPGNTHSARTQYWHLTNVNINARTYMPNNSWLNNDHMNINVNQAPWCNATSGGGTLNFYKRRSGLLEPRRAARRVPARVGPQHGRLRRLGR